VKRFALPLFVSLIAITSPALADDTEAAASDNAALAVKLTNPVANMIQVPFKIDFDDGIGPANADRETYLLQPVIPISLSDNWSYITRTIVPYVDMSSPTVGGQGSSGMADTLEETFFSPKDTAGGWVWGIGPAMYFPTGNRVFGSGKWSLGPTAVALHIENGWTYGVLAYQVWSIAGNSDRANVSQGFIEPFLSYTTKSATTFTIQSESSINWKTSMGTVPINLLASQLVKIGSQPVSFQIGARFYASRPSGGPDWGLRFNMNFLFPD